MTSRPRLKPTKKPCQVIGVKLGMMVVAPGAWDLDAILVAVRRAIVEGELGKGTRSKVKIHCFGGYHVMVLGHVEPDDRMVPGDLVTKRDVKRVMNAR
jgi:hypothetical protein